MTSINSTWPYTAFNETYDDVNQSVALVASNITKGSKAAQQCLTFRIVFYFCLCGTLCILGIMGNTLSILILQKDRSNAVAAFLLQALAIADNSILLISFITLSLFYGFLPAVMPRTKTITAAAYVIKYVEPFAFMSHTATIWVTVLLATNRFIAICRPFDAPSWCTRTKARIQVAIVFSFAILYNFPRFFQTYFATHTFRDTNETFFVAMDHLSLGRASLFGKVYTNALYSILVVVTPLTLIIILNTLIILEMKRMKSRRVSVSSDKPIREENITKVMVVIMIMVVCCHLPDRITVLIQAVWTNLPANCDNTFYYIQGIVNLLMILNSSTNFLIYYILRQSFRKILRQRLCGGGQQMYHLSACDERLTNGDMNMLDRSSIRTRDTCTNVNINNNLHHNKRLIKAIFNNI